VSLIVAVLMFACGQWYLEWAIRRDVRRGERFVSFDRDQFRREVQDESLPGIARSLIPLVVTLVALNILPAASRLFAARTAVPQSAPAMLHTAHSILGKIPEDPTLAIFLGVAACLVCLGRWLAATWTSLGDGFLNGLLAAGSTSAVVGFGAVAKDLPAFQSIVEWVTRLPADPLIGAAIAVAVIAAIAGSASGGQGIALPIIKPIFIDELGVAPRALHRVVAIASGTLDSLPANGYMVMLIRNICGDTHARAYGPIFVTTVLTPLFGTALAIALFKWFPSWAQM
jgi:H+/gluconate symporter-like permease